MLWPDKKVLLHGFGLLASIAAFHIFIFTYWNYNEFSDFVAVLNAERSWLQNLNVYRLSQETYWLAKAGYCSLFILAIISLYLLKFRLADFWPSTLISLSSNLLKVWQAIPKFEKIIFLVTTAALFLARIYFILKVRVHIDESANYLWFLRKGLLGVLFYYPIPNNHVLYSLFCLLFEQIFTNPFWVLKLPAFLLSCISTILFFLGLRAVFPFLITYVTTFGISFSYYALYFSVYGRGYILMLICYFLTFIALIRLTEKNKNDYWLIFLIATVAGFYSIPVFIYPFIPLFFFGLYTFIRTRNKAGLINLLTITFFAAITSLILYLPIMLVSGPHQLFGNMYVTQVLTTAEFFNRLPVYLIYMQGALLGQETIGFYAWLIASLILGILILFKKRFSSTWAACGFKPEYILLVFLSSILPWILLTFQKIFPPERVWLFKTLPDFLILAFSLQVVLILLFKNTKRYILVLVIGFVIIYSSYEILKMYREIYKELSKTSKRASLSGSIQKNVHDMTLYPKSRFFLYQKTATGVMELQIDEGKRVKGKEYDIIMLDNYDPDSMFFDQDKFQLLIKDKDLRVFVKK